VSRSAKVRINKGGCEGGRLAIASLKSGGRRRLHKDENDKSRERFPLRAIFFARDVPGF
jgi:hypothetical protein